MQSGVQRGCEHFWGGSKGDASNYKGVREKILRAMRASEVRTPLETPLHSLYISIQYFVSPVPSHYLSKEQPVPVALHYRSKRGPVILLCRLSDPVWYWPDPDPEKFEHQIRIQIQRNLKTGSVSLSRQKHRIRPGSGSETLIFGSNITITPCNDRYRKTLHMNCMNS